MLGKRLVQLRGSLGLTQEEISTKLNISRGTYAHYEIGKRNPDYETLQKIADFFSVTIDYILGRSDNIMSYETQKSFNYKGTAIPSSTEPYSLSPRDIAYGLEEMIGILESNEMITFDGEPLDDATKELIRISLENSMRLLKQLTKKIFTPE